MEVKLDSATLARLADIDNRRCVVFTVFKEFESLDARSLMKASYAQHVGKVKQDVELDRALDRLHNAVSELGLSVRFMNDLIKAKHKQQEVETYRIFQDKK